MKTTGTLAALALVLLPNLAAAQGCHDRRPDQTAMSCGQGYVWDETKGTCVLQPSS
ncbi:MAG: hypothetical protein KBF78_13985 [Fuscovulum sp.]|jgi:hypothetical protein|nr:hypothetical protein [Fuscovulum sp.]